MEKNYLLLTLGHNSSAIFVDNSDLAEQQIIGYEQERLSGIKADSQFPRDAINEILKHVAPEKVRGCRVLISHWFNFNIDCEANNKYITQNDIDWLHYICGNDICTVTRKFSHHDAHAYSTYEFFKYHREGYDVSGPVHCLVVDGFGNDEEVLSLYTTDDVKGINLIHRVYGYNASLGLMYQYATAFCGMKENQDEYKFLGYEAHIDEYVSSTKIDAIDGLIEAKRNQLLSLFNSQTSAPEHLPHNKVIDFDMLKSVRKDWYEEFQGVCNCAVPGKDTKSFAARCVIAYYIQNLCERTLVAWLNDRVECKNLVVAGGTFYNVKLNQVLLSQVAQESFSVIPLAGDQGAAIGMYAKDCNRQFAFGDLCWGVRGFYNAEKLVKQKKNVKISYIEPQTAYELEALVEAIATRISDNNIVNVVMGNMEFGPRALCHTSTIFLPTSENTHCNNEMNGRNEVMPCAPICTRENAYELFDTETLDKVIGSDKYMICTHVYHKPYSKHYGGVMHKKPLEKEYTGRPQLIDVDEFMYEVLEKVQEMTDYKALVNTSFNVHGRPIAFDIISILQNYDYQVEHAEKGHEPFLYIINTNKQ